MRRDAGDKERLKALAERRNLTLDADRATRTPEGVPAQAPANDEDPAGSP